VIEAIACAKVNLSLRVGRRLPDGLHRLSGLFQSVAWVDRLSVAFADEDALVSVAGGDVISGWDNLAWRAVTAVRATVGSPRPLAVAMDKRIPTQAGLGGGSADAAAALAAAGLLFDVPAGSLEDMAAGLGSDVPFCLLGGTAEVGGTGAAVKTRRPAGAFALAVVVPPIELATGTVYTRWDELGSPAGPGISGADLPPQLRGAGPLVNDLYPAAAAVAPQLDDWRAELMELWGRPVALTGSGPGLFGYFLDRAEAQHALEGLPPGARAAAAAVPVPFGWALRDDTGVVTASRQLDVESARMIPLLFEPGRDP